MIAMNMYFSFIAMRVYSNERDMWSPYFRPTRHPPRSRKQRFITTAGQESSQFDGTSLFQECIIEEESWKAALHLCRNVSSTRPHADSAWLFPSRHRDALFTTLLQINFV